VRCCRECSVPPGRGPPYLSDDPEPTDYKHFEIYAFSNGTVTRDGTSGEGGIGFNYGGAPNLQLTATVPVAYDIAAAGAAVGGLGNIELAAKYLADPTAVLDAVDEDAHNTGQRQLIERGRHVAENSDPRRQTRSKRRSCLCYAVWKSNPKEWRSIYPESVLARYSLGSRST
jgi:hypothetical protein